MSALFQNQSTPIVMLVYGIRGSNPPRYALYDVDNVDAARQRIEAKHPEYIYLGNEIMVGRTEAQNLSRAVNRAMEVYPGLLAKYPLPQA